MNNRKPVHKSIISTGTTSIVLIFVMLSLLTFAVLSLVSAQADLRLSRKSAQRTTDYYAAENAASAILLDLVHAQAQGPDALASSAGQADVDLTEDGRALYEVPLGEDQVLAVELALPAGGEGWRVLRWQAVSRYDWAPDDTMDLLGVGALPAELNREDQQP